ncbi:MAG: hypothetical protein AAF620_20080 [Bacteroidota bacterium]
MKNFIVVLLIIFSFSCEAQNKEALEAEKMPDLLGSKWIWNLGDGCTNYFIFSEKCYSEYNCELGEEWQGNYEIKNDTLILYEKVYTSNIPNEGKYVVQEYRMFLFREGLGIIYSRIFEGESWKEIWIKSPKVFFKRVKF